MHPWEEMSAVAFEGKELGDERLSAINGGRAMHGYIEHTVKRGETLAGIAQKYHVTEHELCELNQIKHPKQLYIGQIIRVPVHIR